MNTFTMIKRIAVRIVLMTPVVLAGAGCGVFQLNDYNNFDDWFAGRGGQEFDPNTLHCGCDDTTFPGYVGNAIIRTPVYFFYDMTIIAMIPVASPYYCCKSFFGEEKGAAHGTHEHTAGEPPGTDQGADAAPKAPEATTTTPDAAKPEEAQATPPTTSP